jgi:O-antigen ligase
VSSRAGVFVLAALLPAAALAVDPAGWYWFGPAKWLAVTAVVPAGAALLLRHHPLRTTRAPTVAAAAFLACLVVASITGVDPLYAWIGTPERHLGLLTWALCALALVAGQTIGAPEGRIVAGGATLAGLGVGALAATEALGWEPLVFDVGRRLTASFGSSAYLGAATALLLPVAVGSAVDGSSRRSVRACGATAVPVLTVATFGSGARAAWVGLAAAAMLLALSRRRGIAARPRISGAVAVSLVLGALALATFTPVGPRVASAFDRDEPGGSGRIDEWRVATEVIVEHPVLGVGPEGYRVAFAGGVDEAYERTHGRDPLPDRAHSAPLDIALAGGAPTLVAWLCFLALCARHVWRAMRSGQGWLVGLATGIAAYQIAQLLLFPIGELEPAAWLIAGVVIGATSRRDEQRERVVPRLALGGLAAVALLAAAAGALDVAADRAARDSIDARAAGDNGRAYDLARRAAVLRPDEVRLHLLEARAALADERGTATALDAVDRALDRSPDDPIARRERASMLVARARATLLPADIRRARDELAVLIADDPHNAESLLLAGQAARLDGDVAGAERAWQRAESLAPHRSAPAASLALLYLENDRPDDAAAAAARALAVDPQDPAALEVQRQLDGR